MRVSTLFCFIKFVVVVIRAEYMINSKHLCSKLYLTITIIYVLLFIIPVAHNMNNSALEMSSSEDEDIRSSSPNTKQDPFIELLKKHSVLFNKSQVPSVKAAKETALSHMQNEYVKTCGRNITMKQIKKNPEYEK